MRTLGICLGILMIISVFLAWETYIGKEYFFLTRVSDFLGIDTRSFDALFNLDFLPVASTLLFLIGISLSNKHISLKIIALAGSLLAFIVGLYDIIYYLFIWKSPDYIPGEGMWTFTICGLFALIISILVLLKKDLFNSRFIKKLFDRVDAIQ